MLYWVSALVQEDGILTKDKKTTLLQMNTGELTFEEAKNVVTNIRKNYHTFSAWIDVYDENDNKTVVFHECYCNMFGNIQKP